MESLDSFALLESSDSMFCMNEVFTMCVETMLSYYLEAILWWHILLLEVNCWILNDVSRFTVFEGSDFGCPMSL